jgi:hypothetical protein
LDFFKIFLESWSPLHEEVEFEKVDIDKKSIVIPSCLDDFIHIGRLKWDMKCFYFEGDPIYDTNYEGKYMIDKLRT